MVSKLTQNTTFFSPFAMQSFTFGSLTNRAVSLFSVLPIKRVSIFTMSLSRIYSTNISRIKVILLNSQCSKVSRINTSSPTTNVVNNKTFGNISDMHVVGNSMSPSPKSFKEESSVPIFVGVGLPHVTFSFLNPFTIKSNKFFGCVSSHIPFITLLPLIALI